MLSNDLVGCIPGNALSALVPVRDLPRCVDEVDPVMEIVQKFLVKVVMLHPDSPRPLRALLAERFQRLQHSLDLFPYMEASSLEVLELAGVRTGLFQLVFERGDLFAQPRVLRNKGQSLFFQPQQISRSDPSSVLLCRLGVYTGCRRLPRGIFSARRLLRRPDGPIVPAKAAAQHSRRAVFP